MKLVTVTWIQAVSLGIPRCSLRAPFDWYSDTARVDARRLKRMRAKQSRSTPRRGR